jgi:hypothetical protein
LRVLLLRVFLLRVFLMRPPALTAPWSLLLAEVDHLAARLGS